MTDTMALHRSPVTGTDALSTTALNRVSWGAIFAGVAVALAVQFLLNLLGVGVGAAVIDPATGDNPAASTFSIVGGLWYLGAGLIAAFVGGYIATRLSGRPSNSTGGFHGLTSWAVTTLFVLYLLTTTVGSLVGGAFSGLTSVIGGVGQTATTAAAGAAPALASIPDPLARIEGQIRDVTGGNDPAALRDAAISAVRAVVTGDEATAEDARNRAAQALARAQNIPVEQARTEVDKYEADYRQAAETAKQQATEAAQAATQIVSSGAILAFLALLLGAVAAWFGGSMGTRYNGVALERA